MSLVVFLALCFAAAMSGAAFPAGEWYDGLRKPSWRPPKIAFPIVWSVLYVLIAVAGWRVWTSAGPGEALVPMAVFGVQLVLNAAWSWIFFGLRRMRLAFAELVVLWMSIVAMILAFHPVDPLAAWLLAPYLAWVTAAGALNRSMLRLNPAYAR